MSSFSYCNNVCFKCNPLSNTLHLKDQIYWRRKLCNVTLISLENERALYQNNNISASIHYNHGATIAVVFNYVMLSRIYVWFQYGLLSRNSNGSSMVIMYWCWDVIVLIQSTFIFQGNQSWVFSLISFLWTPTLSVSWSRCTCIWRYSIAISMLEIHGLIRLSVYFVEANEWFI
jgi:hypothetical protein